MVELRREAAVASTMEIAHRMAADGADAGAAVIALEQTGARGTRGRRWSSGLGGVWVSVVLHPPDPPALDVLSLRLGLALAELLEQWIPGTPPVQVKWPNDLQIAQHKLGGILCEARWRGDRCQWVIAGVGINVENALPPELAAVATRLRDHAAGELRLEALRLAVVAAIARCGTRGGGLDADELARWAGHDALAGRRIADPLPGIVEGIGALGVLRVRGDDGQVREATAGVARIAL